MNKLKSGMKLGSRRNRNRRVLLALLACLSMTAGTFAGSAQATSIAFALDAQVGPVTYTGGSATLDPVVSGGIDPLLDATSVDCLAGSCDVEAQDWVLFEVSVLSGNVGHVGLSLLDSFVSGLDALGMGYLLGGGPVQDGTAGSDAYSGTLVDPDTPVFSFVANGGGTGLTGTSLVLFVAYADGTLPQTPSSFGFLGDGAVSFMVEPFGGAGAGSANGSFTSNIDVIPEPTTAVLIGMGFAILGMRGKGRSV